MYTIEPKKLTIETKDATNIQHHYAIAICCIPFVKLLRNQSKINWLLIYLFNKSRLHGLKFCIVKNHYAIELLLQDGKDETFFLSLESCSFFPCVVPIEPY